MVFIYNLDQCEALNDWNIRLRCPACGERKSKSSGFLWRSHKFCHVTEFDVTKMKGRIYRQLWQFAIGGVSSHLFAMFQGHLKVTAGVDTSFTVTSKDGDDEEFSELYTFKWTTLLIPPTTLLLPNFIGVVADVSNGALCSGSSCLHSGRLSICIRSWKVWLEGKTGHQKWWPASWGVWFGL